MGAIMQGVFGWFLRWLDTGGMKILGCGWLFYLFSQLVTFLGTLIPSVSLQSIIGNMPAFVIWGLILVQLPAGIGILGAFLVARFVLRRIPFIGG